MSEFYKKWHLKAKRAVVDDQQFISQVDVHKLYEHFETELAELRERCATYENEIVYALRYLESLGMTYDKHESEPEYQIKVSFQRAIAKYKGDKK